MELGDITKIFQGFKNLIFPNEKIESIAEEKLKRCYTCPVRDQYICSSVKQDEAVKDFTYNSENRKKGVKYSGCGCILKAKVRSTSQCPLGKF